MYDSAALIAAQLLFAYAFDMLLGWSRRDTYALGFGPFPVVFSINLFLWFKSDWFYLQFLMVALGFAAKELIRWDKEGRSAHIFNPSSFPLAVFSLGLMLTGTSDLTWGRDIASTQFYPPHMYLMLFLIGLPGQFFFGVTTMFFAIGAMTQSIIELELGEYFGKRRTRRMIDKLENHFIICGYGRVGRYAATELQRAAEPFVIVDRNPERVDKALMAGMLAVAADSTRDETLRAVSVERARGLISALATDADNLFVILSAKNLNPRLFVATRAAEEEAESKLRHAGADAVFTPYTSAGYRLAQAVLRPHVFQFFDLTTKNVGLEVDIEQVRVPESSDFVTQSLEQTQIRREHGVIVLAIRKSDGRMLFNPPADTVIAAGDHLIVMGEPSSLRTLETATTAVPKR